MARKSKELDPLPILPTNAEAEENLLGHVIADPAQWPTVANLLEPQEFSVILHQEIWAALQALTAAGSPIDHLLLASQLVRQGVGTQQEMSKRVGLIYGGKHKGANVAWYARLVHEAAQKRAALASTERLQSILSNGSDQDALQAEQKVLEAALEPQELTLPSDTLPAILTTEAVVPPWAINSLLCDGDISILSGPGGVGKSLLVYHMALCFATATPLFGRFPVVPRNAAILDLEMQTWEVNHRLQRLCAGIAAGMKAELRVIKRRLRIDQRAHVAAIIASIKAWDTKFLIIDSWRRCLVGDDNKAEVSNAIFLELDRIRFETGCGIIIIDHDRKKAGDPALDTPDQMLRGTADKRNMADAHYGVHPSNERLAFTPTKTRHGSLPKPFLIDILGLDADLMEQVALTPINVVYAGPIDSASETAQDSILAMLQAGPMLRPDILEASTYSHRTVCEALASLKLRGLVTTAKNGHKTTYALRS